MKTLTLATLAAATLLGATAAHAQQEPDLGFYGAVDAQYHTVDYNGVGSALENNHEGLNFALGIRPTKHFGVEVGYFDSTAETRNGIRTEFSGLALDAIGYLPVLKSEKLELMGSVGVVRQRGEVSALGVADREKETKLRIGAGAQYHFNDKVSTRLRVLYSDANFGKMADSYATYSLGVSYRF